MTVVRARGGSRERGTRISRALLRVALPAIPGLLLVALLAWGLLGLAWRSIHEYDAYTNTQGGLSLTQFFSMFAGDQSGYFLGVIARTLAISLVVMAGSVALALPVAYFIVRTKSNAWRMTVLGLSLVPFLMGDVVRAFGWLLLLGTDGAYGWTTGLFVGGGRLSLIGTPIGVVLGIVQTMTPISIFVLLPAVRRIDPDIERAAETLGAKPGTAWMRVTLPMLRPGMIAAGIVSFSLATTQYAIPEVIGGGRLPFAANAIQSAFFSQGNINLGSALAVLMLVVVLAFVGVVGARAKTPVRHPDLAGDAVEQEDSR
jgi:putative spermidine/putrescine transport system permease protein